MVGTPGIPGERFAVLTPSAFNRPDFICGIAIGVRQKLTLTMPDIRSCCAGPLPLYGTWLSLIPVMYMKSSVTRCCAPPLPELAKSILPGSFFACAISSFTNSRRARDARPARTADSDADDRREVGERVVRHRFVHLRRDHERRRGEEQRVAVGFAFAT